MSPYADQSPVIIGVGHLDLEADFRRGGIERPVAVVMTVSVPFRWQRCASAHSLARTTHRGRARLFRTDETRPGAVTVPPSPPRVHLYRNRRNIARRCSHRPGSAVAVMVGGDNRHRSQGLQIVARERPGGCQLCAGSRDRDVTGRAAVSRRSGRVKRTSGSPVKPSMRVSETRVQVSRRRARHAAQRQSWSRIRAGV